MERRQYRFPHGWVFSHPVRSIAGGRESSFGRQREFSLILGTYPKSKLNDTRCEEAGIACCEFEAVGTCVHIEIPLEQLPAAKQDLKLPQIWKLEENGEKRGRGIQVFSKSRMWYIVSFWHGIRDPILIGLCHTRPLSLLGYPDAEQAI